MDLINCRLDEALNGGILNHEITQIHGCSLSGKTSLCIRFMLEMIHNNSQIIFFPTGYQFSYKIIFQRLYVYTSLYIYIYIMY